MFINQILTKLKTSVYSKSETETLLNSKGFITSEIDSMGNGWVRFKCGLQICWGQTSCSASTGDISQIGPNAEVCWGSSTVNFGSAFKAGTSPRCTLAVIDAQNGVFGQCIMVISNAHVVIEIYGPRWNGSLDAQYIAIGRWK